MLPSFSRFFYNFLFLLPAFSFALILSVPGASAQDVAPAPAAQEGAQFEDVLKKIEESDSEMPELPPAANAPVLVTTTPPPAQTVLAPITPVIVPKIDGGVVPVVPALPASPNPVEDLFFDAESLAPPTVPGLAGQQNSVVRTVNPQTEPASKYIIVKKNADPGSQQAQLVSAHRALILGRYDSALMLYDKLYEKNKKDQNILLGRAMALQKLEQDDAAIRAYEELLDLKPNHPEAQINMLGLLGQKYPAVALQRLLDLQQKQPDNVALVGQIAVVQAKLGYYDEALKYLGMAASLEPNNANHYYNMAVIADRAGNKKDAVKFYEKTLEIDAIYSGGSAIPRDSVFDRLAQLR
ncbi:MAG: tetratricopeptide repeat protein [Alphaproteobacteria bacterium]